MNINLHGLPENRLKKCIFLMTEEFEEIIEEITDGKVYCNFDDGVSFETQGDNWELVKSINAKLSEYFGVGEVTSIHDDGCDCMGVWIVYKESEEKKEAKSIECCIPGEKVSYSISDDNTLTVFLGKKVWFTVEDVKKDSVEDMISEVINDMGYIWLDDGKAVRKEENL